MSKTTSVQCLGVVLTLALWGCGGSESPSQPGTSSGQDSGGAATSSSSGSSGASGSGGGDTASSGDGSSSGASSSGGGSSLVPAELPATVVGDAFVGWFTKAVCATSVRCGLRYQGQPYSSAEACGQHEQSHWAYYWLPWTQQLADSAAGVGWDGKVANKCLKALFSWPCKRAVSVRSWPTKPCEEAFIGAVKTDQECMHDAQCQDGFCDNSGKKEGCAGSCKVWKGVDEICGIGARCKPGTWCRDGSCAQGPDGGGIVGDSCGAWPCAEGVWCSGTTEEPGKCLPYPGKDEECLADKGCASGLQCDNSGDSGVCVQGIAEGKPCVSSGSLDNHVESCAEGFICTPTLADYNAGEWTKGKCMKAQSGANQWCDGVWQCGRTDLFCKADKDGGYCTSLPDAGQACEGSAAKGMCKPGLICPDNKTCKKKPTLGEACDINQNICTDPYVCNSGKCTKVPKVSEPCLKDNKIEPCGYGATCVGGTCVTTCN